MFAFLFVVDNIWPHSLNYPPISDHYPLGGQDQFGDSFRDVGNVKIGLENTKCDIKNNMKIKLQP